MLAPAAMKIANGTAKDMRGLKDELLLNPVFVSTGPRREGEPIINVYVEKPLDPCAATFPGPPPGYDLLRDASAAFSIRGIYRLPAERKMESLAAGGARHMLAIDTNEKSPCVLSD